MTEQITYGYEEDFQRDIVSAVLQDPTLIIQYDDVLQPSYLDYDYLSSILRAAKELAQRCKEPPSKAMMVDHMAEFCSRYNLPTADREFILGKLEEIYISPVNNVSYIRDKVVDFGRRQSLRSAILKIVAMFQRPKKPGEDIYEDARSLLDKALNAGLYTRGLGLSLYPILSKLPQMVSDTVAGSSKKVPTGFPSLDEGMGCPGRGELWVVAGLPGRGKSSFLVNIGVAALKLGFPVLHYTIGDLEELDVGVRYASRLSLCAAEDVIRGAPNYMRKADKLSMYNPHLYIKYFPPDSVSMDHIRAHTSRLITVEEVNPAIIIVDYPEELKMPVKNDLYQSGGKNYSAMKAMASEFDALVWAASQPTRWEPKHQNDVIKGINLGESSKKFQKVDGMVSWNMTNEEELMGRGRIWKDKCRRGKSFKMVYCDVDLEKMLIQEGRPPEDMEA